MFARSVQLQGGVEVGGLGVGGRNLTPSLPEPVNIGGMESAHTGLKVVYFPVLVQQIYLQYSAFWWEPFHVLLRERKKRLKDFKSRTAVAHFQGTSLQ